jgi:hypothetical protein
MAKRCVFAVLPIRKLRTDYAVLSCRLGLGAVVGVFCDDGTIRI